MRKISDEEAMSNELFYESADLYSPEGQYALNCADSVFEYTQLVDWFSLYRAAYEWASSKKQADSYLNAVLDEQSDRLVWDDKEMSFPDFHWADHFRMNMFREYFSSPQNKGSICFTGRTYGYIV